MTSLILSHKSLSCISMHTSIYADIAPVQGPHFPSQQPIPWLKPAECLLYDPGRGTHTLKKTHTHIHVCATKPCLACNNSALGLNSNNTCTKTWQQKKDNFLILKLD